MAGDVDAIDSDIVNGTSALIFGRQADPWVGDKHLESRIENPRFADFSGSHQFDRAQIGLLEMESVGDHELDPRGVRGANHGFGVLDSDGHGLFTEYVDTGGCRRFCVLAELSVGERW